MARIPQQLGESLATFRSVFQNAALRRVEFAYLGAALGSYANVIVVSVYAYHHGGATAVGLVMFARMGTAALFAPFAAGLADRLPQRNVMLTTDLARVAILSGTAVAAGAGLPALVYALSVTSAVVGTAFRPAEASLTPTLATTPEELTAANVVTSTFDSTAGFAGPALGALLLVVGGTPLAFVVIAGTCAWSAFFVARLPAGGQATAATHIHETDHGILAGFRSAQAEPRLRLVIGLYGVQAFVAGAYGVLIVVIALQVVGLGNAGVGLLEAGSGIGSLVGAALALVLVRRKRTAGDFAVGLFLFGAPLLAIGALPRTWATVIALFVVGVGNSLVDISAVTLVQRSAPPGVIGRVFGLLDATLVGAIGLGSLATPLVVHLLGARGSLLAMGAILPLLAIVSRRALATVDAGAVVPEAQLLAIATVPFLDVLPLQRKEALAAKLVRVELPAGTTLFAKGQPGNQLYILSEGALEIELPTGPRREDAPGFVGEIALLHDVPRTATVRVVADATLWTLDGKHFLDAVSGHTRSRSAADAVVASRGVAFSA